MAAALLSPVTALDGVQNGFTYMRINRRTMRVKQRCRDNSPCAWAIYKRSNPGEYRMQDNITGKNPVGVLRFVACGEFLTADGERFTSASHSPRKVH